MRCEYNMVIHGFRLCISTAARPESSASLSFGRQPGFPSPSAAIMRNLSQDLKGPTREWCWQKETGLRPF
ncbi:hypothetical protein AOLI_G00053440 [Acnodon oligacanthus]